VCIVYTHLSTYTTYTLYLRILYTHRSSMYGLYISFLYVNVKSIHLSLLRLVFTYRSCVYSVYTSLYIYYIYSIPISRVGPCIVFTYLSCTMHIFLVQSIHISSHENSTNSTSHQIVTLNGSSKYHGCLCMSFLYVLADVACCYELLFVVGLEGLIGRHF